MKVVIAALRHETNTFSPVATPLSAFFDRLGPPLADTSEILSGQDAIDQFEQTGVPFAAFLRMSRERGAQIVVPLYANASPSAPTDRGSFEMMCHAIVDAVSQGCDAILLDLHGAMVAEGFDDAEGELVSRIRDVAPDTPMAVALDFHSNLSDRFFQAVDVVTGYCTYPHVDTYETGERAARTLFEWIDGGPRPCLSYQRLPMLTHMNRQTPASEPMKTVMDRAMQAEQTRDVLNASVFGGFPLADTPWTGLLTVVVANHQQGADKLARELAELAWKRRADFVYEPEPVAKTIGYAATLTDYPVILADHGNNCGAGGSVDAMETYEAVLKQGLTDVIAGPVFDPEAVQIAMDAGIGSQVTLAVGGKTNMPTINQKGKPLELSGRVTRITDGQFVVTGPMFTGVQVNMGNTVVLDVGNMQIVISAKRVEPFDLGVYTHCGLDPTRAKYVLLHSRQHFKAGFEPIAAHILLVSGPGVCTSDYDSLPFEHLNRPIYPLDASTAWL